MGWVLFVGAIVAVVVFLRSSSKGGNTSQISSSNNHPVISQSFKCSIDLAVNALTSDARFKNSLANIRQHMNLIKGLCLGNGTTGYMLKYIKKEAGFNTGTVSIYAY